MPQRGRRDSTPSSMVFQSIYHDVRARMYVLQGCVDRVVGQTYEGGISASPGTEAHGAYAFCALACLSILGPPQKMIPRYE